jgi:hypothetical protein
MPGPGKSFDINFDNYIKKLEHIKSEHGTVMDQYKNVPRHIFLTAIIG